MKTAHFRHSIRFKLFVVFFLIVASLQFAFWILSDNVLQTVMLYGNNLEMRQMMTRYQEALTSDTAGQTDAYSEELLAQLSYEWDGNLTLIDKNKSEYKTTVPIRGMQGGMMNRSQLIADISRQFDNLNIGQIETLIRSDRSGAESLAIFVGRVNESQLLFSEKPLNVIRESSKLVSRYIMFSGLITVFIGSLAILLLSKKLTQPIIEIEEQANRIASLEFEPQNQVSQKDEIGSLGMAVNEIAKALKETISELSEANGQLQTDIENERRIEKTRRQFVSNVSHELKTPISMIVGYADGLKFGVAKTPEHINKYCDVILSESEKMNGLINDLLDMSAYQEGHLPMQLKSFDLSDVVMNAAELYRERAETLACGFNLDIEPNLTLLGDQTRIEQVLRNLLGNAFKHVAVNGSIQVGLSRVENNAVLTVYNDGEAICEDELDAIWMSFYRGSQARERQMDGFGIGLALIKEIVEKHEGICSAENIENGVKFVISLPIKS